jgi:hypothetical protein
LDESEQPTEWLERRKKWREFQRRTLRAGVKCAWA